MTPPSDAVVAKLIIDLLVDMSAGRISAKMVSVSMLRLIHDAARAQREQRHADADFLEWLAYRLVNQYGESLNVDFVLRLRKIVDALREEPPT